MRRFSPRRSLSRKLPLLISALLVAAIVVFSGVAYRQLTQALFAAAGVRMQSTSRLLANLFEDSGKRLRAEAEKIAADSAIKRITVASDPRSRAAAQTTLARLAIAGQQTLAIEVRDNDGRQLIWANGKDSATAAVVRSRSNLSVAPKQTTVGPIATADTILYYTIKALSFEVPQSARLAPHRGTSLSTSRSRRRTGPKLSRSSSAPKRRYSSGTVMRSCGRTWRKSSPGPTLPEKLGDRQCTRLREGTVSSGPQSPSSRWAGWSGVAMPTGTVLAPANRFLRDMGIVALLLVLVGGVAALLISSQITGPLKELTLAAEGISSGDYSRRVSDGRYDELGVLAQSFNSMAQQVDELEGQAGEPRTRAHPRARDSVE